MPNFNRFRNGLIIGVAVILLLVAGYIYGFRVLPKATITIQTNTSNINSDLSLTLSSTQTTLDPVNDIMPAKLQTIQKTGNFQHRTHDRPKSRRNIGQGCNYGYYSG